MDIFEAKESSVQSYARSFPMVFETAQGAEIWDQDGNRYLDFLGGAGALSYGHNNPALKDALIAMIERNEIAMSLDLHSTSKALFLEAIDEHILQPRGMNHKVHFTGPTGANAVEAALKIARKATGRQQVFFFTNGFHGMSLGALSVTGNSYNRDAAGVTLTGTQAMPFDGYFGAADTIAMIDKMIQDPSSGVELPAAMIVECVQGEGGLNVASPQWLRGLRELCDRHEILLIADDIQAGCGRTGTFFSFEDAGITPDIITLSKSLSGYGLPLSIVLLKPEIDVWKPGEHNGTFRGNNLAFVTATRMIETYWSNPAFAAKITAKSAHLGKRLSDIVSHNQPAMTTVKGRGMMQGIACANPDQAAQITAACFERGLILERAGPRDEVIKCLMPLIIPEGQLDEGLNILEHAAADVLGNRRNYVAA